MDGGGNKIKTTKFSYRGATNIDNTDITAMCLGIVWQSLGGTYNAPLTFVKNAFDITGLTESADHYFSFANDYKESNYPHIHVYTTKSNGNFRESLTITYFIHQHFSFLKDPSGEIPRSYKLVNSQSLMGSAGTSVLDHVNYARRMLGERSPVREKVIREILRMFFDVLVNSEKYIQDDTSIMYAVNADHRACQRINKVSKSLGVPILNKKILKCNLEHETKKRKELASAKVYLAGRLQSS